MPVGKPAYLDSGFHKFDRGLWHHFFLAEDFLRFDLFLLFLRLLPTFGLIFFASFLIAFTVFS